ncbi:UbiA family prenyltransferase [Patescibacteria group bacterium]|nr:UbiA family prenyltransferase [Patescibacteria group bacterium]
MRSSAKQSLDLSRIIRISRFPHFWVWSSGFFLLGGILANKGASFGELPYLLLFLWFTVPANIFLNGLNDIFDYETDRRNPRKQALEPTIALEERRSVSAVAAVSLLPAFLLFPFISNLTALLVVVWILVVGAYNIPPFRFKQYPVTDILFGGVGHYMLISMIGYAAAINKMPGAYLIFLGILFMAGGHCLGAALDMSYDAAAGIQNSIVRLGSEQKGLALSLTFYIFFLLLLVFGGFYFIALLGSIFPVFILWNMHEGHLEERGVEIFQWMIYITYIFGFIVGLILSLGI